MKSGFSSCVSGFDGDNAAEATDEHEEILHMPRAVIVDTDADSIGNHSFCGFSNPKREGHRRKCEWLRQRFTEGLRFKVLQVDGEDAGMIEYAPGEHAWRPVEAEGYMVIHCIMLRKKHKGRGYGKLLLGDCIQDAQEAGMHGVVAVTSDGTWMADERLFVRSGFECVDTAPPSYKLLVKRLRAAPAPRFSSGRERTLRKHGSGLVIFTSDQCPYVAKGLADILQVCARHGLDPEVVEMRSSHEARLAPSAYGVFNIVWDGKLVAEHPISGRRFENIVSKLGCGSPRRGNAF